MYILQQAFYLLFFSASIDFLDKLPQSDDGKSNILFRFSLTPPSKIILQSHWFTNIWNGYWDKEVVLEDDNLKELLGRTFRLTIIVLSHADNNGSEFLLYLNNTFQTTFECPVDITKTSHISSSPNFRIYADIKDF